MTVSGTSGNGSWALEPGGAVSLTAWVKYTGNPGPLKYIASKGDFRYVPNGSDCAGGSYALYTGYNGQRRPDLLRDHDRWEQPTSPNLHRQHEGLRRSVARRHRHLRRVGRPALRRRRSGARRRGRDRLRGNQIRGKPPAARRFGCRCRLPGCGTCPDNSRFPGSIDEVRVHNRALPADEIAKLHDPGATTPPDLTPAGGGTPRGGTPEAARPAGPRRASPCSRGPPGLAGTRRARRERDDGASRLLWDLNNDGRIDFDLPAYQPFLSVKLQSPKATTVKLTAVAWAGPARSAGRSTPAERRSRPSLLTQVKLPVVAASSATGRLSFTDSGLGLPDPLSDTTVVFSLVEAQSCFKRIDDVTLVPSAERSVVQAHYASEKVNAVVTSICNQAAKGTLPQSMRQAKKFFPEQGARRLRLRPHGQAQRPADHAEGGGRVVVYRGLERVISSSATVSGAAARFSPGAIDLDLRNSTVKVTGKAEEDQGWAPRSRTARPACSTSTPRRACPRSAGSSSTGPSSSRPPRCQRPALVARQRAPAAPAGVLDLRWQPADR